MLGSVTEIEPTAIKAPGRSAAKAVGTLLMAGAGLVWLSLVLPHPSGGHTVALLVTSAVMFVGGLLCRSFALEVPLAVTHVLLALSFALTALLIVESSVAVGQYGTIFVWGILVAAYFFPRRVALAHLGWLLVCYAISLALVESTSGYSPVTRWLFSAVSLTVVLLSSAFSSPAAPAPTTAPVTSSTSPRTCSRPSTSPAAASSRALPGRPRWDTPPRTCAAST